VSNRRLERFSSTFSELKGKSVSPALLASVVKRASKKVVGAVRWEVQSRASARRDRLLYRLLELAIERELAWPRWLPAWQTPRLYDLAEAKYTPSQSLPARQVLLFRATTGAGNDKPHRETFERPDFGWSDWLPSFETIDVAGGHSSMLQEPYVEDVAAHLVAYIEATS
jgi:thioesterase domain-containing protein